ncbi:hypothetical protein [Nocardia pseudobrasiliensis]|uniref:EamA-like transporter family protein n=1 Tax=Nocardia pseudobrasiliensis TaxID=45979 RepID=A0A370IBF9_9NOCA|nr:hypothetical protein [Nocardia pseudobrasiliensis]RDI68058.1 hypothetical protein DFR76_102459 [Nocardia pseudobrasiliensis]
MTWRERGFVDLDIPLSAAGILITAFARDVVFGGPPFAVLSLRCVIGAILAAAACPLIRLEKILQ